MISLQWIAACLAGCFLASVMFVIALVKLPKPVPDRWEIRLFLLMGMPAETFLRFTILNGVDPVFWHRALYATYISLMNSFFWIPKEQSKYPDERVQAVEIKKPPIFIVGHYRSGTSLLHELMNKDDGMVAPNVFQW
jgi:omega-hydroxy-beta-dihydromenaquinone-9 sulfotransferase